MPIIQNTAATMITPDRAGWYGLTNGVAGGTAAMQPLTYVTNNITVGYNTVPNITPVGTGTTGAFYYNNLYNNLQQYVGQTMDANTVLQVQNTVNNFGNDMYAATGAYQPYHVTIAQDGTGTIVVNGDGSYQWMVHGAPPTKSAAVREAMRKNLVAERRRRAVGLPFQASAEELKARETLRDMISENEWRRYLTNGFIMTKGQSGKWYQIFQQYNERIRVYENGKHVEMLCIHSDGECPPTDHVINMKILAEVDESALWKGSNKHGAWGAMGTGNITYQNGTLVSNNEKRSLLEIAKSFSNAS
jgi:hypothetical protein